MQLSILLMIAVVAFGVTIASALGKAPLWIAVLLLSIAILILAAVPIR
jgi:hypothetical protein